jgi:hypothetical protein
MNVDAVRTERIAEVGGVLLVRARVLSTRARPSVSAITNGNPAHLQRVHEGIPELCIARLLLAGAAGDLQRVRSPTRTTRTVWPRVTLKMSTKPGCFGRSRFQMTRASSIVLAPPFRVFRVEEPAMRGPP